MSTSGASVKISCTIITYNEERNIEECLRSVEEIADEIIVVDSFSTDKTPEICKTFGVKFIQNPFDGHIQQKNFAMEQATYDYILSLDADERLSKEMAESIKRIKQNWTANGYRFNRLNNYSGAWLKHCWYPDAKIRLWDRRTARWGGENPHDKVLMEKNDFKVEKGDLIHYAYRTVNEHFEQTKKFAKIAAEAKFKEGKRINYIQHIILNPVIKFLRLYIFKLGFLDGYYGFVFSKMAANLNYMKYKELWKLKKLNTTDKS